MAKYKIYAGVEGTSKSFQYVKTINCKDVFVAHDIAQEEAEKIYEILEKLGDVQSLSDITKELSGEYTDKNLEKWAYDRYKETIAEKTIAYAKKEEEKDTIKTPYVLFEDTLEPVKILHWGVVSDVEDFYTVVAVLREDGSVTDVVASSLKYI